MENRTITSQGLQQHETPVSESEPSMVTNCCNVYMAMLGRKGGQTTIARYGKEYLVATGRKGGKATVARHGRAHLIAAGQKGRQAAAIKHGEAYMATLKLREELVFPVQDEQCSKPSQKQPQRATSDEKLIRRPDGAIYQVKNQLSFAREHGLRQSSLSQVLRGKWYSTQGWRLPTEEELLHWQRQGQPSDP
ncbi:MAG TPA: hypothetical protein VL461_01435 [Dictyobacter sp.]|nr:hypothetical protein [Dictyobacter sp.]